MWDLGRSISILGTVLLIVGLVISVSDKIPLIGKLPGDILIKREGFTFYFPLTTSILLSVLLAFVLKLFNK